MLVPFCAIVPWEASSAAVVRPSSFVVAAVAVAAWVHAEVPVAAAVGAVELREHRGKEQVVPYLTDKLAVCLDGRACPYPFCS